MWLLHEYQNSAIMKYYICPKSEKGTILKSNTIASIIMVVCTFKEVVVHMRSTKKVFLNVSQS